MPGSSVVGQLRVILGLDTAQFLKGASEAQKQMRRLGRDLGKIGSNIADVGRSMTLGITAPIAAAGFAVVKMAGDFEAAMNQVAISTQASAAELQAMNDLALELGKSTVFSASEAASAMDMMAKAGLSAQQILGGAAKAALDLAAATGSELDPAAAAITDTLSNFKMTTADLPQIIDQITGAVNQSKFDFDDFQYAMGSAGGVAGKVGVDFKDFAAVLAGTSSSFSSGQDAGTSFKTMLIALGNPTKKAKGVIAEYGLAFYDAAGKLKPMRDIAEQLRVKFAGLSDQARTSAMADLFGSDAMRSGLGLMTLGAEGLDKITAAIAKTDAAAQSAQRMKGFNAQMEQLKGSVETLAIRLGQSGILETITRIVEAVGNFVDRLSSASPATLRFATVFALVAAAVGPVVVAIGTLVSAVGTIATAIAPLLPVVSGGLVAALGAAALAAAPFIAAGVAIYAMWDRIGPVLAELGKRLVEAIGPRVTALIAAVSKAFGDLWAGPLGAAIGVVIDVLGQFAGGLLRAFGHVAISLLAGFLEAVTGVFTYIADALRIASRLLSGDFSGAWTALGMLVDNICKTIINVVGAIVPGISQSLMQIYTAAKQWLQDKLGAVFSWVGDKVRAVGDAFYTLWDRVVGHSYVPDLVDGIAAEFKRLQAVMVDPADKAAKKVGDRFRDLAASVQGIMRDLFPSQAIKEDFATQRAVLEQWRQASPASAPVVDLALTKLAAKEAEALKAVDTAAAEKWRSTVEDVLSKASPDMVGLQDAMSGAITGAMGGIGEALEQAGELRDRMRNTFRQTFGDGLRAALDGNFGSWFSNWWKERLARTLEDALGKLIDRLADATGGSGKGAGGLIAGIISIFKPGGSSGATPGFGGGSGFAAGLAAAVSGATAAARGGSFKVTGAAGVDRNLVSMRLTKGELVDVTPANDRGSAGNDNRGGIVVNQTFAPHFAGNAATKEDLAQFASIVKADTISTIRDIQSRR